MLVITIDHATASLEVRFNMARTPLCQGSIHAYRLPVWASVSENKTPTQFLCRRLVSTLEMIGHQAYVCCQLNFPFLRGR